MPLPKREIDEIVQLHVREGNAVQEVFVEGREDKNFYEAFLRKHNLGYVAVFDVGTVNVPDCEVVKLGLQIGKKGRVVTLAALLEGKIAISQVVCVADADFDHFNERSYPYSLLLLTDYTSIELYVFNEAVLTKVLGVALNAFPKSAVEVMQELAEVLTEGFLVRISVYDLNLTPDYPEHSSFCLFDKGKKVLSFRSTDYINQTLRHYTDRGWRGPLMSRLEERRGQMRLDNRLQIHGHDFLNTFGWYVRQHTGYGDLNAATFSRVLLGFLDFGALADEPMLKELLRRLQFA